MANVLLCSDEPILAEGLARILAGSEALNLISYCPGIDGLQAQMESHQPDLLLIDRLLDDLAPRDAGVLAGRGPHIADRRAQELEAEP